MGARGKFTTTEIGFLSAPRRFCFYRDGGGSVRPARLRKICDITNKNCDVTPEGP